MHSYRCIFSFVLMCALIFHFAIRNRPKFKLHLNSKWVFLRFVIGKGFSISLSCGPKPTNGPASLPLSSFVCGPAVGPP
jgi:hypothetical protein